jgi:hypothetical protein
MALDEENGCDNGYYIIQVNITEIYKDVQDQCYCAGISQSE